jgi:hypothetical protein
MKERINKLDHVNVKIFYSTKDIVKRMKRQASDWEKLFAK